MIPCVLVLKERPLEDGHRLFVTWTPTGQQRKPKPDDSCAVWCGGCGERRATGSVERFQRALELASQWHGPEASYRRAVAEAVGSR